MTRIRTAAPARRLTVGLCRAAGAGGRPRAGPSRAADAGGRPRSGRCCATDVGEWLRVGPVGLLLTTALALIPTGCGPQPGRPGPDLATLRVEARFPEIKAAMEPGSVHLVRAEAFELAGTQRVPILRDSASAPLGSGQSHFRLEMYVPPADLYLIRLTMHGTTGTADNPSDEGLLYLGETTMQDIAAGSDRPVTIPLLITVPLVRLETVERGWHVTWSPLPGALGYILRESSPPPGGVTETPTAVTDTLVAFPPAFKIGPQTSAVFQVAARFPAGFTGAFSPKVTGDVPKPEQGAGPRRRP